MNFTSRSSLAKQLVDDVRALASNTQEPAIYKVYEGLSSYAGLVDYMPKHYKKQWGLSLPILLEKYEPLNARDRKSVV